MKFKVWDDAEKKWADEAEEGGRFFLFEDGSLNIMDKWNEFDGVAGDQFIPVFSTQTDKNEVEIIGNKYENPGFPEPDETSGLCHSCKQPRGLAEDKTLITPCPHCGDDIPF